MHLYDLYRWKFVHAMNNDGAYWSEFVNILGIQHHELLYIIDKYNDDNMFGSVAACIISANVCRKEFTQEIVSKPDRVSFFE